MSRRVVGKCTGAAIILSMMILSLNMECLPRQVGPTVVWWHQCADTERQQGINSIVERFNATNEWQIAVDPVHAGSYNEIYERMLAAIAAGDPPNLVVAYQNQAAGYQLLDALVDLNAYVNDPEWGISDPDDFFSGILSQDVSAQFGGQRLGFPAYRSMEILYYNADWLAQLGYDGPPTTWTEFRDIAAAATSAGAGTVGYEIRTGASTVFAMVISRGGEFALADGSGYRFDTPEMRETMEFVRTLYDDGYATTVAEAFGDQTDFGDRIVAMTTGSTAGIPFYEAAVVAGATGPFEWEVAAIPHSTALAQANLYGASLSIPRTNPEAELAAWQFVRWFTEPDQQAEWVEASNYFPVRKSVAQRLSAYFEANPQYEEAFTVFEAAEIKTEPPYSGYPLVRDRVTAAFDAILDGADIDATLAELELDANEIHEANSP